MRYPLIFRSWYPRTLSQILLGTLLVAPLAFSTESPPGILLGFEEAWKAIEAQSKAISASRLSVEASEIAHARAGRHWFPRIYAAGRSFVTDDPGTALFSKLSERNVTGLDFAPLALNDPGYQNHSRFTLGTELPLFEGGSRVAEQASLGKAARSRALESEAIVQEERSRALAAFGELVLLKDQKGALQRLKRLTDLTLSRYEIGARSNPLGHSGYLGLRSLLLRLNGELAMNDAKTRSAYGTLAAMASFPPTWTPAEDSLEQLLQAHAPQEDAPSLRFRSLQVASEALDEQARGQWSRFLPRIALFGEGDLSIGQGVSANSYTAGIELRWNLLSAPDFGAVGELKTSARALEHRALAVLADETARRTSLRQSVAALSDQVRLATESLRLLEEQSEIARKLFQSGQINALQLTDVYARRVDLVSAKTQMELGLLQSTAGLLALSPSAPPAAQNKEALPHE